MNSPTTQRSQAAILDWDAIDTVLLDMDGTLLDLRFDNYFWLELVPQRYAAMREIPLAEAKTLLAPWFAAHHGQLTWYCTDHWSRELNLDIPALKREAREHIAWLPGAQEFLAAVRAHNKRLLLVTNAHHDTVAIKHEHTGLDQFMDAVVSSHQYGYPKEHAHFWPALMEEHPFERERTVFVDDSLPVLRAARTFGIAHVIAVAHPDSSQAARTIDEFPAVRGVAELLVKPLAATSRSS